MKKLILTGVVLFSAFFAHAGDSKEESAKSGDVNTTTSTEGKSKSSGSKSNLLVGGDLGLVVPLGAGARDVARPGLQIGLAGEYYLFNKLGLGNSAVKNISVTAHLTDNFFGKNTYDYDNYWYGNYKLNIVTFGIGANYHFLNPGDNGLGLYVGLALTANQYNIGYDVYNHGNGNKYDNTHYSGTSIGLMPRFGLQYGFNANWVLNAEIGTNLILESADYYNHNGYYAGPSGSLSYLPLNIGIRYRFQL